MKKILITAAVVLLIGNEVLTWAALVTLAGIGVGCLLKADFEQSQGASYGKNDWT